MVFLGSWSAPSLSVGLSAFWGQDDAGDLGGDKVEKSDKAAMLRWLRVRRDCYRWDAEHADLQLGENPAEFHAIADAFQRAAQVFRYHGPRIG